MRLARLASLGPLLLASALGGCDRGTRSGWSGYVEGDYVYVASPVGGALQSLDVRRGQTVAQGAPLFRLESDAERAALAEAKARAEAAQAQAANTEKGRRPPELAMTEAQLAQARAQATLAESELARQQQLLAQGFVSASRIDDARTQAAQARQRVRELEAALQVARLPARPDERAAAAAAASAAQDVQRQAQWRADQKAASAPAAGLVADTFFRVGEWVAPGQPVVALLPPGNIKARFFVPEAQIGGIAPGQAVTLSCDGCGAPIAARIDFVATQPEYTPPVIYSNAQRARLVVMVEARPAPADATRLRPGQPLDVAPAR